MGREDGLVSQVRCTLSAYRQQASVHHLGSMLLVVIVLLTHFSIGSASLVKGVSYADFMCFSGIACATAILIGRKPLRDKAASRRFIIALTVAAAVAFLFYQLAPSPGREWLAVLSALAEGAFIAATSIFWFDFFAEESMEEALISLSICLIGGCAVSWFLLGVSSSRFTVGFLVLILAAGTALIRALDQRAGVYGEERPGMDCQKIEVQSPLMLLVAVLVLCFACMLSLSLAGRLLWHSDDIWLFVAPAALIVLVVVLFFRKVEIGTLLYIALIIAVLSVLLSSFFLADATVLFIVATNGFVITISLAIVFMLKMAKGSTRAPHEMGALLLMAVFAGSVAGRIAAEVVFAHPDGAAREIVATATIIVLVVSVIASLNSKSMVNIVRRKLVKARSEEDRENAERARIAQFASEKGLGSRESEVLFLLLDGCSAHEVAEKMFVADGTAKAHIRHVYQKLDVHDRESLFEVVQQVASQYSQ